MIRELTIDEAIEAVGGEPCGSVTGASWDRTCKTADGDTRYTFLTEDRVLRTVTIQPASFQVDFNSSSGTLVPPTASYGTWSYSGPVVKTTTISGMQAAKELYRDGERASYP
jgi:hypothetical protein